MESTNFELLQQHWPQLCEHAIGAERYALSDPHTAIIKLRCFAEQLVGVLYRELDLPCENSDGLFEKLKAEAFINVVDEAIVEKLHAIRMLGNKAAHGRRVQPSDALSLVHEAYLIGQWLYKTYSGTSIKNYPIYVEPEDPKNSIQVLSTENEQLQEQLKFAKKELNRIKESERLAQSEVNDLKKSLNEAQLQAFKKASSQAATSFDLAPENIRKLITLHDAFAEYDLTDNQAELVDKLSHFLDDTNDSVFLLKGYAGTGKTFITKGLTEYFRTIGRNYVLAAPTGKASKVIAKKTLSPAYTIHKTIYSFKDIAEYRESNVDGSETYKFYAQLAVNDLSVDTVFIVDEASMIPDVYHEDEFFRFGSGYLLRDFFKYVNLDHNNHHKKVIFIGDDAQLPPMGMKFSPALDSNYLSQKHNVRSIGYELKEVVRQKANSGVMHNSIRLRDALSRGVFNQLYVDLSYPDIEKVEHENLIDRYLESCDGKINAEAIVLSYSNADVASYNRHIRKHFFQNRGTVTQGDKVMAVSNSNSYGFFISNGDFGLIREILNTPEQRTVTLRRKNSETGKVEEILVTLTFRNVIVGFNDFDDVPHFFKAKIIETLLYNEHPQLTSDENKALYLDFCIRNSHLKRNSLEFKKKLKTDPYFNALRLKFGYAITCHKAQGSEWNHVFVNCKGLQPQLSAEYFRWFYTASTRAINKLYLLDPPYFKIGSGIKMVASPQIRSNGSIRQADSKHYCEEGDDKLNEELKNFGIPSNASFSLEILKRVKGLISDSDINIQSVNQHQYMESYFFQKSEQTARIDIGYNGKGRIKRLSAHNINELSGELLEALSPLKDALIIIAGTNLNKHFEFGEDFLNEFHQRLVPLAKNKNILIANVEAMDWKQRYTFVKHQESAVFDIFYNGKKQFSKSAPVSSACSSNSLISEVQLLLTEGLTYDN